jgi:hypothetical protein
MYGNLQVARSPSTNSTACEGLRRQCQIGRFDDAADGSPRRHWRTQFESSAGQKFALASEAVRRPEAGGVVKTTLSMSEARFEFRASATQ